MASYNPRFLCSPGVAFRVIIPGDTYDRFELLYPGCNLDTILTAGIRAYAEKTGRDSFPANQMNNMFATCVQTPHERGKQFVVSLGSKKHVSAFVNRGVMVAKLRNCVISELLEFMADTANGPDSQILSSICVTVAVEYFRLFHLTRA